MATRRSSIGSWTSGEGRQRRTQDGLREGSGENASRVGDERRREDFEGGRHGWGDTVAEQVRAKAVHRHPSLERSEANPRASCARSWPPPTTCEYANITGQRQCALSYLPAPPTANTVRTSGLQELARTRVAQADTKTLKKIQKDFYRLVNPSTSSLELSVALSFCALGRGADNTDTGTRRTRRSSSGWTSSHSSCRRSTRLPRAHRRRCSTTRTRRGRLVRPPSPPLSRVVADPAWGQSDCTRPPPRGWQSCRKRWSARRGIVGGRSSTT